MRMDSVAMRLERGKASGCVLAGINMDPFLYGTNATLALLCFGDVRTARLPRCSPPSVQLNYEYEYYY